MTIRSIRNSALAGLLGAALLVGSPIPSSADPGKHESRGGKKAWKSDRGEKRGGWQRGRERREERVERSAPRWREDRQVRRAPSRREERQVRSAPRWREKREVRTYRPRREERVVRTNRWRDRRVVERRVVDRRPSYRVETSYRAPRWHGGRYYTTKRYYRTYQGIPVYREYISYRYRPHYRPVYGWRYYCAPYYYYPSHIIYVRPVRFFVAADFAIGGVGISARYVDPGPVYGCNFCDARFDSYHDYEYHVEGHCSHTPDGYRVVAREWEPDWHDDDYDDGYYED